MHIFYWAVWAKRIVIVKEHQATAMVAWKIMNDLPSARKLWQRVARGCPPTVPAGIIGPKEAVDSISEWNSDRIKWVRMMLDKD